MEGVRGNKKNTINNTCNVVESVSELEDAIYLYLDNPNPLNLERCLGYTDKIIRDAEKLKEEIYIYLER